MLRLSLAHSSAWHGKQSGCKLSKNIFTLVAKRCGVIKSLFHIVQLFLACCTAMIVRCQYLVFFLVCQRIPVEFAYQQAKIFGPHAQWFASVDESLVVHIQVLCNILWQVVELFTVLRNAFDSYFWKAFSFNEQSANAIHVTAVPPVDIHTLICAFMKELQV